MYFYDQSNKYYPKNEQPENYTQLIISSLANEMCQRGPGDAGSILPLVGYILLHPLDTL